MAMSMDQLKTLVTTVGLRFFEHPSEPMLMLACRGLFGNYQFVMALFSSGTFFQIRSVDYLSCPADHAHLGPVLRLLGELNYRLRLVKFGWDASDGEITVYADCWVVDGTITQSQLQRILANYLAALDLNFGRIRKPIEPGKDPGEIPPERLAGALDALSGLPREPSSLAEEAAEKEVADGPDNLDEL